VADEPVQEPGPDDELPLEAEILGEEDVPTPPGTNLTPAPAAHGGGEVVTIWNTRNPSEIVQAATDVATALSDVIEKQGLARNLGGRKKHVEIEGWQTAGTLLGAQAMTVDTQRVEPRRDFPVKTHRKKYGWQDGKRVVVEEYTDEWTCQGWSFDAVAEVRTLDGRVIGRGEATCSREEENWMRSTDSAVKGMAQTRACSRALRQALGFIVGLAGYSATPQEEMEAAGVVGFELTDATEEDQAKLRAALTYLIEGNEQFGSQAWDAIVAAFDGKLYSEAVEAVAAAIRAYKAFRELQAEAEASADESAKPPEPPPDDKPPPGAPPETSEPS
jgi:hypothetical protein